MSNNVVLIVGPGRCGTSFLWYLLHGLNYNTSEHSEFLRYASKDEPFPYIIKGTGGLSINLHKHIDDNDLIVDHIFVAFRNFEANLKSMIKKKRNQRGYRGLTEEELEKRLKTEIPFTYGRLFQNILERNYPYTVVEFPKSAQDMFYCYHRLTQFFDIKFDEFKKVWLDVVKPEKIRNG